MVTRQVNPRTDAGAISRIYNHYVTESTATFDLTPLSESEMERRILDIAAAAPYLVCEEGGEVTGFCYAHEWKPKAAYADTLESTVYVAPGSTGRGIGRALMLKLIDECRERGITSLIACITAENTLSCDFHRTLGFTQVSEFQNVGRKFGRMLSVVDFQLQISSSAE